MRKNVGASVPARAPAPGCRKRAMHIKVCLHSLRKNSVSRALWEGHDFSRADKSLKISPAFSRWGFALCFSKPHSPATCQKPEA
jgi:hypothetical protein